jgi:hypothetical protein
VWRMAREERDPARLRQLLLLLLAEGDLQSVHIFLERVEDPRTSADAFNCLASAPNPPVEALFQYLRSPLISRRRTAALVLGRLNQPMVSRELIGMVVHGIYLQEAMFALVSSSETTAQQFLADAARNPKLLATLQNTKRQFHNYFPGGLDHAMALKSG